MFASKNVEEVTQGQLLLYYYPFKGSNIFCQIVPDHETRKAQEKQYFLMNKLKFITCAKFQLNVWIYLLTKLVILNIIFN